MPVSSANSPAKSQNDSNSYLGVITSCLRLYGTSAKPAPKDGSVRPRNGFDMTWEVAAASKKHVKAIGFDALKDDNALILGD